MGSILLWFVIWPGTPDAVGLPAQWPSVEYYERCRAMPLWAREQVLEAAIGRNLYRPWEETIPRWIVQDDDYWSGVCLLLYRRSIGRPLP